MFFSDHPSVLFGKANDARFQHVVAEIELIGNEWPITTNKDAIQWGDQGLQEQFIADLMKDADVKKIFDIAKKTHFRTSKTGSSKTTQTSSDTAKKLDAEGSADASMPSAAPASSPVQTALEPKRTTTSKRIQFKDKTYFMDIVTYDDDPDRDFFKLKTDADDNGKVGVEVNLSSPFLAEYVTSDKATQLLYIFVEAFALSRLEAVKSGLQLNDSFALETALNEIMRKAK